jgi:group I intron endonuclease
MELNMNKAGVYKLECINNGKVYIGKTINFSRRLRDHKNSKRKDRLQNAIRKHGWDSFSIEILEIVENFDKLEDNDHLLMREAY